MTLSDTISQHVAETRFEDLPQSTLKATKRALLDGIGVIYAATRLSDEAQPFVTLGQSAPSGLCTLLGQGRGVDVMTAALVNGAMAHALDYEDAFDDAPVHPNASLIPALLAVAQTSGKVSGREFLTAMAIGCDLVCRMGLSLRQPMEVGGWYPPPILGAFGAAAACARLSGFDAQKTRDALSLMLFHTAPGEIKYSRETTLRAVREGFFAQGAVQAMRLAGLGVRGFETPLEGKSGFYALYAGGKYELLDLTKDLGTRYLIDVLSFKPWPACRGTHAYIELAISLMQKHGFDWTQISRVALPFGEVQAMLVEPEERKKAPATAIDAKFSIPFSVAIALRCGTVTLDDFGADSLNDPDLLSLTQRMHPVRRDGWGRERATAGAMSIWLMDGRYFEGEITTPLGHPDRPISDKDLTAKFINCTGRAAKPLSANKAEALASRIMRLEDEPDIGSLVV